MANSKINIDNKTSKIVNEKTKAQNQELENLKKQKDAADSKAKQMQEELEKIKKENKKKEEEELKRAEETKKQAAALAASAIGVIGANAKKKPSFKTFLIGLIIGLVVGFLGATLLGLKTNDDSVIETQEISDTLLTHTELDFENVILGEVQEHQELIVMEQPLEVSSTITKSGLANLDIFSKTKNINYVGKGMYTVDMSKIDAQHIDVDMKAKKVYISIPHAVLQETILDVNSISFDDTEKGLLAFGDLKLTLEEQNEVEKSVKETMTKSLDTKELYDQADEFAKLKTWQIFQPLVTSVSPEYIVEMKFN